MLLSSWCDLEQLLTGTLEQRLLRTSSKLTTMRLYSVQNIREEFAFEPSQHLVQTSRKAIQPPVAPEILFSPPCTPCLPARRSYCVDRRATGRAIVAVMLFSTCNGSMARQVVVCCRICVVCLDTMSAPCVLGASGLPRSLACGTGTTHISRHTHP